MRLAIDLDDVIRDLYSEFRRVWAQETGYDVPREQCQSWQLREVFQHRLIDPHELFFERLTRDVYRDPVPLRGAVGGLMRLRSAGHTVLIVSAQPNEQTEAMALRWLVQHRVALNGVLFTHNKLEAAADLYVDDSPVHLAAFAAAGRPSIIMDAPYNRNLTGTRVSDWTTLLQRIEEAAVVA